MACCLRWFGPGFRTRLPYEAGCALRRQLCQKLFSNSLIAGYARSACLSFIRAKVLLTLDRRRSFTLTLLAVLHRNLGLLEKYVDGRDSRLLLKALRYTNYLRQYLPVAEIRAVVATHVLDRERVAAIEALAGAVLDVRSEPVSARYGLLPFCSGASFW